MGGLKSLGRPEPCPTESPAGTCGLWLGWGGGLGYGLRLGSAGPAAEHPVRHDRRPDGGPDELRRASDAARRPTWTASPPRECAFRTPSARTRCARPAAPRVLTGCYSHVHGIRGNSEGRDSIETSRPQSADLPQAVARRPATRPRSSENGTCRRTRDGFDEWKILPGQGVYFDPEFIINGQRTQQRGYATDITTDFALDFLRQNRGQAVLPALPAQGAAPPLYARRRATPSCSKTSNGPIRQPTTTTTPRAKSPNRPRICASKSASPATTKRSRRSSQPEAETQLDFPAFRQRSSPRRLRRRREPRPCLSFSTTSGLAEDTLIIYTTDNGYFLGEHGWYDKRFMYEPSLRMPLLLRYPRLVKPGRVEPHMALNVDIAPTILDFAGVPVPEPMQGRSLRPAARGRSAGRLASIRPSTPTTKTPGRWPG